MPLSALLTTLDTAAWLHNVTARKICSVFFRLLSLSLLFCFWARVGWGIASMGPPAHPSVRVAGVTKQGGRRSQPQARCKHEKTYVFIKKTLPKACDLLCNAQFAHVTLSLAVTRLPVAVCHFTV